MGQSTGVSVAGIEPWRPNQEVWSSPACEAYTGTSDRNCVECPLEGPVCEAIQGAYVALYGHGDPAALLIGGKWLLARSLELWMDPVSEEVPT